MIKKLSYINTYDLKVGEDEYSVALERIKNSYVGAPRYKAFIHPHKRDVSYVYTFTGHCFLERDEAEHILAHHLKEMEK